MIWGSGNQNLVGLGLRFSHMDDVLEQKPQTPWFEVIADDFLDQGPHHGKLSQLRQTYPLVFHSVGLNLGGTDPLHLPTLQSFKKLHERYEPLWVSDHLCWSAHGGNHHFDLLPMPLTSEALDNLCGRIHKVQEVFGRPLGVENITSYLDYRSEDFSETQFIKELVARTGCELLLDVSNVLINHRNRGRDAEDFFATYPLDRVKQIHLAGGSLVDGTMIDSHASPVPAADVDCVRALRQKGLTGHVTLERDAALPSFLELERERLSIEERLADCG